MNSFYFVILLWYEGKSIPSIYIHSVFRIKLFSTNHSFVLVFTRCSVQIVCWKELGIRSRESRNSSHKRTIRRHDIWRHVASGKRDFFIEFLPSHSWKCSKTLSLVWEAQHSSVFGKHKRGIDSSSTRGPSRDCPRSRCSAKFLVRNANVV